MYLMSNSWMHLESTSLHYGSSHDKIAIIVLKIALSQPLLCASRRCGVHNMLRPIRIISFSCCIYLCVWFYQFKYAKSDLYDYGDDKGYFWCDHCYCGLEKQTVLNHEYCCISATEGCKKASFVENDERWWCPNSTVLSKASNSCNKHCYDSNVIHSYFYLLLLG